MTKEELEQRLNAALKEIEGLKKELAKTEDSTEIPDFPPLRTGDSYFYLTDRLGVNAAMVRSNPPVLDYNMFLSDTYAKEFSNKCKLIAMLLHCKWHIDRDYTPDWDNENEDEEKWQVFWSNMSKKYEVCDWVTDEYGSVFFSTEEKASKAAAWLNERVGKL